MDRSCFSFAYFGKSLQGINLHLSCFILAPSAPSITSINNIPTLNPSQSHAHLIVTWSAPVEPNGLLLFYKLCALKDSAESICHYPKAGQFKFIFKDLSKYVSGC